MILIKPRKGFTIFIQAMGLLNTLRGLILVYTGLLLPFVIWILEGFYRNFPIELEEAAIMDGCTPLGVFLRVVLPLSTNGPMTGSPVNWFQTLSVSRSYISLFDR